MKQTFEEADKNGDGLLNIEEIYQLLHKLNVNLPRRKVRQMFQVRREMRTQTYKIQRESKPSMTSFIRASHHKTLKSGDK